jgi:uncharacterized surface protein with fasciclin (FAS1) repeats
MTTPTRGDLMRRLMVAGAVAALVLGTAACSDDGDAEETTGTEETTSATQEPTEDSAETAEADIVDTAVAAGSFTTLATALEAAGLVETLKGEGPYTVFAPTDDAFAALPDGTLDDLLAEPEGALTDILTYHVIEGEVMAADVLTMDGQSVATVQGAELTIRVDGDQVMLEDATGATVNVTQTDIGASNGVIHVIDGVLMPG